MFGNIPDGGGCRVVGKQQGDWNRQAPARHTGQRNRPSEPRLGTASVHTVLDDHSRVADAEVHTDERAVIAIGVLERAVAGFTERGVTVQRVLSDNDSAYKSHAWRDACVALGIRHKRTRPYRPKTNGKIERFHRPLADGWAYARFDSPETARRDALTGWPHFSNQHRHHSANRSTPSGQEGRYEVDQRTASVICCQRGRWGSRCS